MKVNFAKVCVILFLCVSPYICLAQGDGYGEGMKIKFDSTGTKYIRFMLWSQLWMRYDQNNPGSTVNGKAYSGQFDIALRSSRLIIMSQITKKFMVMVHMGINNQTLLSGGALGQGGTGTDGKKPQLFIHEATMEHVIYKDNLTLGGGLNFYGGLSRKTMCSTATYMTLDAPIANWRNIDADDQFARNLGIFAKGRIKQLEYRASFYMPFDMLAINSLTKLDTNAAKNNLTQATYRGLGTSRPAVNGYFDYQLFDQESNLLPYYTNTYLGSKKVLNVGVGFDYQNKSMWAAKTTSKASAFDTVYYDQIAAAVDIFADIPFEKAKGALTVYAVYYYNNMGPNFIRNVGISNPANGVTTGETFTGPGNQIPLIGTGHVAYAEAGWLLPPMKKAGRFQVYADFLGAAYQRLSGPMFVYDGGVNWLLNAHHCKITLNYRNRPVFDYTNTEDHYGEIHHVAGRSEVVLQFQAFL